MNATPTSLDRNKFEAKAGKALETALETKGAAMGLKLKPAPALK